MKKYITKSSILVLIVIVILLAGEYIIETSPSSYSYKHNYILENGSNIETIALGTSHAYAGINPSCFRLNTFNMANSAQPLKVDYYTLQKYDSELINLKNVILDLSYISLRITGYDTPESKYNYINYNVFMKYQGDEFSFINSFVFFHPTLFTMHLRNIILSSNMKCDSLGQGNYYNILKKTVETNADGIYAVKQQTCSKNTTLSINLQYLDNIAQFCEHRKIRLIIISTPIWCTYYDNMDVEQYRELQNTIEKLQLVYGCEYYNFMNDSRFIEDDFMDSHHLSNIGAEKFSRILADTLDI